DINLEGVSHVANAKKPDIAGIALLDGLTLTTRVVILAGFICHQKAGDGIILLLHLPQISDNRTFIRFTRQYPVAQKGIAGHERRNESCAEYIFLDFRINIIPGQRKVVLAYTMTYQIDRVIITDQANREKTD